MSAIGAFFADYPKSEAIYERIVDAIADFGETEIRVEKSQIWFVRQHPFAAVWVPSRALHHDAAPLVLSVFMRHRNASSRWKQVAEAAPGRKLPEADKLDVNQLAGPRQILHCAIPTAGLDNRGVQMERIHITQHTSLGAVWLAG
jgi:hypothetical protein